MRQGLSEETAQSRQRGCGGVGGRGWQVKETGMLMGNQGRNEDWESPRTQPDSLDFSFCLSFFFLPVEEFS